MSQDEVNRVIRDAVLCARSDANASLNGYPTAEGLTQLEQSHDGWFIPAGVEAIGDLL